MKWMFLLMVLITGCASIVGKTVYPVTINSTPEHSNITIFDDLDNTVFEGITPTVVSLKASRGYFQGINYRIEFNKEGYKNYFVNMERGVSGWYIIGNIAFGGLVGWVIVDPATGAMWTLPTDIHPNFEHRKK